ncbi:unnamed protein product [Symbiodinium sp. CCMP2592]|nr:unnamed protein product [Symbiodinium sp. CCMP2592]
MVKFLPFFRRQAALQKDESGQSMGARILTEQDVQISWMSDDLDERIAFLQALADQSLPMPQNESQFHAARVFSDATGRSEYRVDQWMDYLQLHGYSIPEVTR